MDLPLKRPDGDPQQPIHVASSPRLLSPHPSESDEGLPVKMEHDSEVR